MVIAYESGAVDFWLEVAARARAAIGDGENAG
jgi:hypothetical protein